MSGLLSSPSLNVPTLTIETSSSELKVRVGRTRSSSIVKVETVGEDSQEEGQDQNLYDNVNAEWVNRKGAWVIHPVLIITGKIVLDTIPGMRPELSWTLTNLFYLGLSYLMFHWVTGIPFQPELHGGAYDDLTMWEQIDAGAHYTPAKKWLVCVPILLFLASTHYTHYNPWMFAVNLSALVFVLIPKLPQLHRQRVRFMVDDEPSGISTPISSSFPRSGSVTPTLMENLPPIKITEAEFA